MSGLLSVVINGVAYGFVLFLMAGGLSITLGLMKFANMAHVALAMTGAYTAGWLTSHAGWSFASAIFGAAAAATIVGVIFERTLFHRFYTRPELQQVLLTIGIVYVAVASATYLFGPEQFAVDIPDWLEGSMTAGSVSLNTYRLFLIAVGTVLFISVHVLIEYTNVGAKIRAIAFNRRMASSCGIDVNGVFSLTFALGSAFAGLAGALSVHVIGLSPNTSVRFLTELLIIVSVGGLGSVRGSLLAAMIFGVIDAVGTYYLPRTGAFLIYATALILLTVKPQGLIRRV